MFNAQIFVISCWLYVCIYIWRHLILKGIEELGKADYLHIQKGSPKGVLEIRKGVDYIKWKGVGLFFRNMLGYSFGWPGGPNIFEILGNACVFDVFFCVGTPAGANSWSSLVQKQ